MWSFDYNVAFVPVFTVLFQYLTSMALFQHTCTDPNEATPSGTYLEYKENEHCWREIKGKAVTKYVTISLFSKYSLSVKMFWQQKALAFFAITVDVFFSQTFMLWCYF